MTEENNEFLKESMGSVMERIIGEKGRFMLKYDGCEIVVSDPDNFPWGEAIKLMIGASMEVWMKQVEGQLRIEAKQIVE